MDKRKTEDWFVEHIGDHTNEVIARAAEKAGLASAPFTLETQTIIFKGKPMQAWNVPYTLIVQLQASREHQYLKFRVFRKRTPDSETEKWPFHKKKRVSRKAAAAKKQLKKICEEKGKKCPL